MKIDLYTASGTKKGQVEISDTMFGAPINKDLIHQAVVMQLANARRPIAHTPARLESKYSTKKMFRQKGTGNARRGSRSAGLLRHGSAIFGPKNTVNFRREMPKKQRRRALFSALSSRIDAMFALENPKIKEPKTAPMVDMLQKLPAGKKYLFIISEHQEGFEKSIRNIPGTRVLLANYLNPCDILSADQIAFVGDAIAKAETTFLSSQN